MNDELLAKMVAHHDLWAVEIADMDSAEAKFHKDAAAELRTLAQQGKVVVTRDEDGEIVMVSRQDGDGKLSCVIASTTHAGGKLQGKAGGVCEVHGKSVVEQMTRYACSCTEHTITEGTAKTMAANPPDAGVTILGWINEDELPDSYPYDAMFPHSKVDGVRLFPVFAPQPKDAT